MSRIRPPIIIASFCVIALGAVAVISVIRRREAERVACGNARLFADSLAASRRRLGGVDSVLALFDLASLPPIPDSASPAGAAGPNRLERKIIAFRMEGVTGTQLNRWLTQDLKQAAITAGSRGAKGDNAAMLAKIHKFETDIAYIAYLRATHELSNDYWHDMTVLTSGATYWKGLCPRRE